MQPLTFNLEEEDYSLIGIHSTEEDYRLAYFLNKILKTKLKRSKYNLDFQNSDAEFSLFEFKDETSFTNYYLINNKFKSFVQNKNNNGLFDGNFSSISYLIPEKNKIDFFLKIEGCYCQNSVNNLIEKLNTINQVITSYSIEPETLKSKDHLIF
ncbi:IPExxxVDY family protein [Lutibacter sp. HS1-25]|uniref:IPExxxVDY family protein n=1 Tax=Lutibacter sp. HS1-25 TaxID=2485000 RepID=UPI001012C1A6|nr:IPExxxVDY family protein [Lutibacter sp. HS1-25]RXP59451.1 IPExxxVDY family protein [Lutibacter sp. HS1-25]